MKIKLFFLFLLIAGAVAFNWFFPFRENLQLAVEFCQHQGRWGQVLFFLLFVICGLFFIPVSLLIMIAGTVYGLLGGYLLVSAAGMVTVVISYGLGKKLWRNRVEKLRHLNPSMEAIFETIYKHGVLVVLLIRLNPFLPFSAINYLFTIPKLDFKRYLLMTFLGFSPDILFYLYIGRMGKGILDKSEFNFFNVLVPGMAIAVATVSVFYIKYLIGEAVRTKATLVSTNHN